MVVALITAIVTQTDASVQSVGKLDEIKKCADQMEIIRISDVDRAIYQSVSLYASSIDCLNFISGMSKCAVENGKMYDIKLGTCDMPLDETDQFYKTVISNCNFQSTILQKMICSANRKLLTFRRLDLMIVEQNFQWMTIRSIFQIISFHWDWPMKNSFLLLVLNSLSNG